MAIFSPNYLANPKLKFTFAKNRDMKKWQMKAIKEIMENFDFAKVRKVMLVFDWTWGSPPKSPGIEELKEIAEQILIESTLDTGDCSDVHYVSTGGFEAACDWGQKGMRLIFVVESTEAFKNGK